MSNLSMTRRYLIALALLLGACHPPGDPPPRTAAHEPELSEGDQRAQLAGARYIGTPGPALILKTIDGQTIDLAKLYGEKPVYLKFWATWCIPCRAQMPGFEHIYETLGDQVNVISVNAGLDDDETTVRAFRDKFGLRMPIVVDDGRLAAALDLQVTPQHVVIGRDAKIAFMSHLDGDRLDHAIQRALAAPPAIHPATGQAMPTRAALHPGDLVQGLDVKTLDGSVVSLGASRDGRPRAVMLFSAFCETYDGIKNNRPEIAETCRRVRAAIEPLAREPGVEWLGIANNVWTAPEDVAEYKTNTHTPFPLALDADGALFHAFGVHKMPTIALIDPAGRLVRMVGPDDRDLAEAVHALAGRR